MSTPAFNATLITKKNVAFMTQNLSIVATSVATFFSESLLPLDFSLKVQGFIKPVISCSEGHPL